jgi:hypothetical protein
MCTGTGLERWTRRESQRSMWCRNQARICTYMLSKRWADRSCKLLFNIKDKNGFWFSHVKWSKKANLSILEWWGQDERSVGRKGCCERNERLTPCLDYIFILLQIFRVQYFLINKPFFSFIFRLLFFILFL